ncbi:MAG: bifunctional (p)ppGpp synthetase/guanosine-3',5'-bis(diphosphate) 3'-pyrophosphohydrolase [Acutalibacteraceae bacterium]|nr:bifunctional (p)ppGpp synthetase/guanosine-3',5'-bis(diphosphate) 3'-pyrophosphohydrolase [Acutalibacteraceae bacterium]
MDAIYENNFAELHDLMEAQDGKYDYDIVRRAFEQCVEAHKGQLRSSKEEFYLHPFNVAKIVVSLGMDTQSVAAALLHDTVEDTSVTLEDIKKNYGEEIALIVDGVTKLGKISYSSKEQQQSENLRKMLMAMAKDIRVIIIKLADRLHNMRTIDAMPDYKQREKSLETLEVFAPIAHRLGIRHIKEELEDLSIKHLDGVAYAEIEDLLTHRKEQREKILKDIKEKISDYISEMMPNINVSIQARVKSIHGIYRKMYIQGKDFDEIYDIYALRIITDTVPDCYNILGLMHDLFRPLPGRFKDYISMPKPNRYQSLHTTVVGRDAIPFEIQIRTNEMHHTAEYGIAAHWKYKEGINKNDAKMENQLAWIRQILESQNDSGDSSELISTIKVDLAQEDVFAVTPKGDVINLPAGATVIDFAFAIHSAVGVKMVGAKVDGKIVPITHVIKTGEIIDILTTNQAGHGPSRDWLKIAVTNQARAKIRGWFKRERRAENIESGKAEVDAEFRRNSITLPDDEMEMFLEDIAKKQKMGSVDDFYAAIGYGGIFLSKIMPRIKDDYNKIIKTSKPEPVEIKPIREATSSDGVIVDGLHDCLIKFSKCCAPLPGDEIIGFITRGHGVSIHKRDCNNVPVDLTAADEPGRWVNAHWASNMRRTNFISTLRISGIDRDGLLADVTVMLYNMHVSLHAVNARPTKDGNSVIQITLSAENVEHLKSIINHLEKLHGVFSVERINQ